MAEQSYGYICNPFIQIEDVNGVPVADGKVYVYDHDTTNLSVIYDDFNGHYATNPVILDELGNGTVIGNVSVIYDIEIRDKDDNLLMSKKNITPATFMNETVINNPFISVSGISGINVSAYEFETTKRFTVWPDLNILATKEDISGLQPNLSAGINIDPTLYASGYIDLKQSGCVNPYSGGIAIGNNTRNLGKDSMTQGRSTYIATNVTGSHAEGGTVLVYGNFSHGEGATNSVYGNNSHVEGMNNECRGMAAHAEGYGNRTSGTYSHAEGQSTFAGENSTHTEGAGTSALGGHCHAEGNSTLAGSTLTDYGSHAEGQGTSAFSQWSHAEGENSISYAPGAHAEGNGSSAFGNWSHAEGDHCIANGWHAHAEGANTNAYGSNSHAMGSYTIALGAGSFVAGDHTSANGINQAVLGKYNNPNDTDIFQLGCGDPNNHINAFELRNDKSMYYYYEGDMVRLAPFRRYIPSENFLLNGSTDLVIVDYSGNSDSFQILGNDSEIAMIWADNNRDGTVYVDGANNSIFVGNSRVQLKNMTIGDRARIEIFGMGIGYYIPHWVYTIYRSTDRLHVYAEQVYDDIID